VRHDEILDKLKQNLPEKRLAHTLAVCETAVQLAVRYNADKEQVHLAALLHDCARGLTTEQQLQYCHQHKIQLDDYMKSDINPVHALIGAHIAEHEYGITDQDVLNAIRRHAVGCENMTLLDKIIFVADGIEPNRTYHDAANARAAAETSIDEALVIVATTIKAYYLQGKPRHPDSIKMVEKFSNP